MHSLGPSMCVLLYLGHFWLVRVWPSANTACRFWASEFYKNLVENGYITFCVSFICWEPQKELDTHRQGGPRITLPVFTQNAALCEGARGLFVCALEHNCYETIRKEFIYFSVSSICSHYQRLLCHNLCPSPSVLFVRPARRGQP